MKKNWSRLRCLWGVCLVVLLPGQWGWGLAAAGAGSDPLEAGFLAPPNQTKPWCYWYWISDNISREGISRDLEAMAEVGIGEALIGNIFLDDVPAGRVKVLSPEWWSLIEHAMREGMRTGVDIGLFNCPGWSQSGGPWIGPEQTMRRLASAEVRVAGPTAFLGVLPKPAHPFQDVAVLAFPAPRHDAEDVSAPSPRVVSTPPAEGLGRLLDGDPDTAMEFPAGAGRGGAPFVIELEWPEAVAIRSVRIVPGMEPFAADVELQAADGADGFRSVRRFNVDRSNMARGVGFMPRGPVTISVPATTAKTFRLLFTGVSGGGKRIELADIGLSGAARLEAFVEKQLGKMHPTPLPMWDSYLWPTQPEPDAADLIVPVADVRDLTDQIGLDGTLAWDVPPGNWVIQRVGMTPTGMRNSPASPEGQGLEVDKMNRELAQHHFDSFVGEVLKRVAPDDRASFKHVVADSYEMGSQNWTDGFGEQFLRRYGYDPRPWMPVLTGRLVGSADESERFLWDLRRLVADRIATEYVGGLRDACRTHGLETWLENYGHWGFPAEFLKYGAESDRIGGEFWVTGDLGSIECRAASSCANTYGKQFVSAEAFTGGPPFQNAPAALKARGDWAFCEGVNHFVLHVYIQQPWEDKIPGVNAWFGTEFNRHNTWFAHSKAWIDYLRRSCWLLQQGTRVADVAYFIGEDAPKMTGIREPELPPGRDFDYINAEVIAQSLGVTNGLLALPHGATYRVLVLPEQPTMRPELLRKIRDLVVAGATVVGPPPSRSPSLENFPYGDEEVRRLAEELWGNADLTRPGERAVGEGRIIWGKTLDAVLADLGSTPDFQSSVPLRFTHRRDGNTDIYFVANPKPETLTATVAFRAGERAPEFWHPDTGTIALPAVYDMAAGVVRLPVTLGPHGSVFVVFREPAAAASRRIVSVWRDEKEVLGTEVPPSPILSLGGDMAESFTVAAWIKPDAGTTLVKESNTGIVGLSEPRNDVLAAPHGENFGGAGHAGFGLAVGTNGVCVFEHGADYYAPTLVHAAPFTDWTHVAVVYRGGRPNLYLNGAQVRSGMLSRYTVHARSVSDSAAQFRGQAGAIAQVARALTDEEARELAKTMPRPDDVIHTPPIQFAYRGDQIVARAAAPGDYEVRFADGTTHRVRAAGLPPTQTLPGPWDVAFTPGWGAPEQIPFPELVSWPRHTHPGIQHYSGRAVYRSTFSMETVPADSNVILDLGDVRDLAVVRLNDRDVGTLWLAPWRVDITDALQPGENRLEIEVVNTWNNRLAGDARLPEAERRTVLLAATVNRDTPLLPAGLLGPVTVQTHHILAVDSRPQEDVE